MKWNSTKNKVWETKFFKWYTLGDAISGFFREKTRRKGIIALPILAGACAYVLGLHPPKQIQLTFNEKEIEVPIITTFGYNQDLFSTLEMKSKDNVLASYKPVTAVRTWGGNTFSERSRQSDEIFGCEYIDDIVLSLILHKEPIKVSINRLDYTTSTTRKQGKYYLNVDLKDALNSQVVTEDKNVNTSTNYLEVLIYYKSPSSPIVSESLKDHVENVDRYFLEVISNGQ